MRKFSDDPQASAQPQEPLGIDREVFVVLLHAPMVDRKGDVVTTAVTNLDIHDIARSCRTFGISKYFIVNPEDSQQVLVQKILRHWHQEISKVYHPARAKALELVSFVKTFEEAFNEASRHSGMIKPFVVMPDARDLTEQFGESWSYLKLRQKMDRAELPLDTKTSRQPVIIVFGTGWGVAQPFFKNVDCLLRPLRFGSRHRHRSETYNHLSVRAAAAAVLDRLFGEQEIS